MPLVPSTYRAKGLFKDAHFSTIYSAKLRRVRGVVQERERFELPDGDFVDIDWSFCEGTMLLRLRSAQVSRKRTPHLLSDDERETTKVALLFHGLEGDAKRPYMLAMAKLLNENGYDVAAVNFRGCSGSQNRKYRSYHSGDTGDIRVIIQEFVDRNYEDIALYGVSLGGNAVLKYLGEQDAIPSQVKVASCIAVPIDLKASLEQLVKRENIVYRTSFLVHLRAKYRKKIRHYKDKMSWEQYHKINGLLSFDDIYTAPAHGFKDALDYYAQASSYAYLDKITIPTLILNAKNDSFLHGKCYPKKQAQNSEYIHLEMPEHGGHVGFYLRGAYYYNELRSLEFFKESID